MNIPPLVVAIFGAVVIGRMLLLGSAAADGQGLRRDEQPVTYWIIVVIAIVADIALFGYAFMSKGP